MCFMGSWPAPGWGGVAPWGDCVVVGVVVVLVVTGPLWGAGRAHPLRGRAVTRLGSLFG